MITLGAGDYRLDLVPEIGGGVARLEWRGLAVLRPQCGPSALDLACFPLVPYSNRIGAGRFAFAGRDVRIAPNCPAVDAANPLHGLGWLQPWEPVAATVDRAELRHVHDGGEGWPWAYEAHQVFTVDPDGLGITLTLRNTGQEPMPAGLGFHPYFPCDGETRYLGLHRTEWIAGPDALPQDRLDRPEPVDWWNGAPVQSRRVDTAFEGRQGDLLICQPSLGYDLHIAATDALTCTVVYVPENQNFFCVEPVTHSIDSANHPGARATWTTLAPGDSLTVSMALSVRPYEGCGALHDR